MKKIMYATTDTETFGGAANPKGVYHIGGRIHDRNGKVYATYNYLISEHYDKINKDEYAKDNFYKYAEMIEDGSITFVATEEDAIQQINNLYDYYNVKYVMAYNSAFDFEKTCAKKLIENREFIDIYLMALQTITHIKKYAKFCRENGFKAKGAKSKSVSTSAETMYSYITNNPSYKEEHTALEDSKIEMQIFLACLKCHKKFTKNKHQRDCKENKIFPKYA